MLKAKDKEIEDKLYQQWCVYAQLECSFNEFKAKCKPKRHQSSKEILKEVYGYIDLFNKGYTKVEIK